MALPVNGCTHLIPAYYSFYRPRKDERLSWPSWLTYSGWLTHISGHPSAAGRAQDMESSPVRDQHSTTVPRHQHSTGEVYVNMADASNTNQNSSDCSQTTNHPQSGVDLRSGHLCSGRRGPCHMVLGGP